MEMPVVSPLKGGITPYGKGSSKLRNIKPSLWQLYHDECTIP